MPLGGLSRAAVALAVLMAGVAGFVDAVGFALSGGLFVSFMSGNATRLAVAWAGGDLRFALTALGLVLSFVIGVAAAVRLGRAAGGRRRAGVLLLIAAMLASAAVDLPISIFLLAAAMGAVNGVYERGGNRSGSLTLRGSW